MNNSKYSKMTMEEYREAVKERRKKWEESLPEDKKHYYDFKVWLERQPEEVKEKYKNKSTGFCEKCNKQCSNIYNHNKSKLHNEGKKQKEAKICTICNVSMTNPCNHFKSKKHIRLSQTII